MIGLTPLSLLFLHLYMQFKTINQDGLNAHKVIEKYVSQHSLSQFYQSDSKESKGFCTYNALESNAIKLKIIENAQHNVVVSGCYCGGEIFDEFLALFQKKFDKNHDFKAFLICSDIWLTPKNKMGIKQLQSQFQGQFFPTVTQEKTLSVTSDRTKIQVSCNHIKALVADYGQYFIVGGSAIQDRWVNYSGEEPVPSFKTPFYRQLTQEAVAPVTFKDCDFVFASDSSSGIGRALYEKLLTFITKWQTIYPGERFAITELLSKHSQYTPILKSSEFEESHDWINSLNVQGFLSGPDCQENGFYNALIRNINEAKESIYISHMYFHPSKELMNGLAAATHRGVKVTLVTNGDESNAPGLHYIFAALSKTYYKKLFEQSDKNRLEIYEFRNANVTLHKKIVVIDEKRVFTGSSNIGFTSLTTSADYELDLIIESPEFARHTLERNSSDRIHCSQKLSAEEVKKIHLKTRLLAPLQSSFKFLL